MSKILILSFSLLLLVSCSPDKKVKEITETIKTDTVKPVAPPEQTVTVERPKYSGSYHIVVTRFEDYYIDQRLELVQKGDSVKGVYRRDFYVEGSDPFAAFVANVKGCIRTNEMGAESILFDVSFQTSVIDSVKLKQHNWAEKMVMEFTAGPSLFVRYSEKDNTIENNYAGGAWDTWSRTR